MVTRLKTRVAAHLARREPRLRAVGQQPRHQPRPLGRLRLQLPARGVLVPARRVRVRAVQVPPPLARLGNLQAGAPEGQRPGPTPGARSLTEYKLRSKVLPPWVA